MTPQADFSTLRSQSHIRLPKQPLDCFAGVLWGMEPSKGGAPCKWEEYKPLMRDYVAKTEFFYGNAVAVALDVTKDIARQLCQWAERAKLAQPCLAPHFAKKGTQGAGWYQSATFGGVGV